MYSFFYLQRGAGLALRYYIFYYNSNMKNMFICIFLLLLFGVIFPSQNLSASDIEISTKEASALIGGGYNRSISGFGGLSALFGIELNEQYYFNAGFSFKFAADISDIKINTGARYTPFLNIPLRFTLFYYYNGLPEYHAHSHTLLPLVAYNADRAGIAIGPGLRFTSIFRDKAIFEPVFNFSAYVNFICREKLRVGICLFNFDEWGAGNMGSYSLAAKSTVKINENWSIVNDITLLQSGSVALSANFYGVAWRGGAKFTW